MADIEKAAPASPPGPAEERNEVSSEAVESEAVHDLVPFPSEFDPDAEPVPRPSDRRQSLEDDELRVPTFDAEQDEEEAGEAQAEVEDPAELRLYLQTLTASRGDGDEGQDVNMDVEAEEEAMNGESEEQQEAGGTVTESTAGGEEAIQPDKQEEQEQRPVPDSVNSSPLSEVPDLPTGDISFAEPEPELTVIPPSGARTTKRNLDPDPPLAESSTAAYKQSKSTSLSAPREKRAEVDMFEEAQRNIVIGKRARKQRQVLEFEDPESWSEGERGANGRAVKPKSGANGKPRGRKKADGANNGPNGQAVKAPTRPKLLTEAQLRTMLKGKSREVQVGPCLRPRYTGWGKCCQCVGKVAGDSCRFREFRIFDIDPDSADILDTANFEDTQLKEDMTALPREFNTFWEEDHILRTERTVAPMLLPVISRELRHIINNKAVVREVDVAKHRSVCDFCSSTIFGGYFFCKKCGRDYCLQCERYFSDSLEAMRESPWDLPDAARPRLLRCTLAPPVRGSLAVAVEDVRRPPERAAPKADPPADDRGTGQSSSKVERPGSPGVVNVSTSSAADTQRLAADSDHREQVLTEVDQAPSTTLSEAVEQEDRRNTPDERNGTDAPPPDHEAEPGPVAEPTPPQPAQDESTPKSETEISARSKVQPAPSRSARTRSVKPPVPRAPKVMHVRPDLLPITRFHRQDLEAHWAKLLSFVLDGDGYTLDERIKWLGFDADDVDLRAKVDRYVQKHASKTSSGSQDDDRDTKRYYTRSTLPDSEVPAIPDPAELEDKSHPFILVPADELDNALFDRLWAKGEPMVVDRVGNRFKQSWTPDAFIQRFGQEQCHVIDCQVEAIKATTVGEFFETFKNPELRKTKGIWKLKDWPSTSDFQSAYPDLYNDFCGALPVPDFTRRDGVLNLYAHFPAGPTKPDIGPKMYNAFEAQQTKGGQGSTRLHMDVADAINIMLHASDRADGQPGCAVWDLFRAEDADKIRLFLKGRFGGTVYFADPIHSQMFYLDAELRKALAEEHGVVSFRVYQYPGQAVFIPAGCAHQVCNLADCIKIALDFVSPHNVSRCQQLMLDFRKENYVKAWKDDVLQLYNVMWYSWLNAQETRQRRLTESESAERARLNALTNGSHLESGPDPGRPGGHPSTSGVRTLTTQVSSVRDEPTPTPQTQSPVQSKESTPVPALAAADAGAGAGADVGTDANSITKEREQDRTALSKLLFEAMLKKNDLEPPPPVEGDQKASPRPDRAQEQPELRTKMSDLVKKGWISADAAVKAIAQSMRNDQKGVADWEGGGAGEPVEFTLANLH